MHITNHIVSHELCDTLNALSDYCRTKVSYMKRLCHVWSAVIHYYSEWLFGLLQAVSALVILHIVHIFCQKSGIHFDIKKSRLYWFYWLKHLIWLKERRYLVWDHKWCTLILFCRCHCSVTLELTKVRSVWKCNLSVLLVISCTDECLCHFLWYQINQFFHCIPPDI